MPEPIDLGEARSSRRANSRDELRSEPRSDRVDLLIRDLAQVEERVRALRVKSMVVVLVDWDGNVATNLVANYSDMTLLLGALGVASSDLSSRLRREHVDSTGDFPDLPRCPPEDDGA